MHVLFSEKLMLTSKKKKLTVFVLPLLKELN